VQAPAGSGEQAKCRPRLVIPRLFLWRPWMSAWTTASATGEGEELAVPSIPTSALPYPAGRSVAGRVGPGAPKWSATRTGPGRGTRWVHMKAAGWEAQRARAVTIGNREPQVSQPTQLLPGEA
jgi:hypothetical protein